MMKYPEDWKMVKLGEIGQPLMCKRILKGQTSAIGDVPFYKIGTFGKDADAFISQDLYEEYKSKYSYPTRGTVLISAAGTIGRLVVFDGKDAYFQDSNIVWIDNDESIALNEYLFWTFKKIKWQTEDGGVISRLYNDNLRAMQIPLPSLAEQKRIAEVLGNADQLINNLEKRIAKKRAIKQGAMQELLTGKKRLPGFTGEWKMVKLGEIGTWQKGQAFAKSEIFLGGHIKCIHYGELFTIYGCVIKKVISRTDSKCTISSKKGDVLFPTSDVTPEGLGRCSAILEDGILLGGDLLRFRPSVKIDSELLSYIINLNKRKIIESVTGSTVRHISSSSLSKILIILPPTLAEQRAIAKILSDMDDEISMLERKLEKVKAVKQGMMQDLLTGKVRLRGQA